MKKAKKNKRYFVRLRWKGDPKDSWTGYLNEEAEVVYAKSGAQAIRIVKQRLDAFGGDGDSRSEAFSFRAVESNERLPSDADWLK